MKTPSLAALLTISTFALSSVAASAATVGNAVIDRSANDSFSNFGFAFTADVFDDGTITDWSAFAGNAGTLGIMVLDVIAPNQFEIAAIDTRTVTAGLNTFTSSISVSSGQILGLYQGTAKVDFDFGGPATDTYSADGALGGAPSVGFVFNGLGTQGRTYSISAEVAAVPLPASLPLALFGIGALGLARRHKKAA